MIPLFIDTNFQDKPNHTNSSLYKSSILAILCVTENYNTLYISSFAYKYGFRLPFVYSSIHSKTLQPGFGV